MINIKYEIFTKDNKNKYAKTNDGELDYTVFIKHMLNFTERKLNGESIRIKKHYNYTDKMNIDVYFNTGWKYTYYNVPCTSGAYIDIYQTSKEV